MFSDATSSTILNPAPSIYYPTCCALAVGETNTTSFFAKLLEHVTFVDTPGVLSGEKQRTQRSYDFTGVTSWFAAKCDLILLLFDPHKLDISDEFKRVIGSLRGHDDKIRIVLNKADQVDAQQASVIFPITAIMPFFSLSLSASQHIPFSCCCSAICMHVCSRN